MIHTSENLKASFKEGRISDLLDISRRSTRVCFLDIIKEAGKRMAKPKDVLKFIKI